MRQTMSLDFNGILANLEINAYDLSALLVVVTCPPQQQRPAPSSSHLLELAVLVDDYCLYIHYSDHLPTCCSNGRRPAWCA